MVPQKHTEFRLRSETLTIPELEQSKAAVLNTLASVHSRRSYECGVNLPSISHSPRRHLADLRTFRFSDSTRYASTIKHWAGPVDDR